MLAGIRQQISALAADEGSLIPDCFLFKLILTMRKPLIALLMSLTASLAMAAEGGAPDEAKAMDLAKANGCLSCHAKAEKIVGPSYASVAEKYKGDADAVPSLMASVRNGSKGKWGRIPMPGHSSMDEQELKTIVQWIMTVK